MPLTRVYKTAKSHLKTYVVCLKNKCKVILIKVALSEIKSSLSLFLQGVFRKMGLRAK